MKANFLFLSLFLIITADAHGQCIESPELTKPVFGIFRVWKTPEELLKDGLPPTILEKTKLFSCLTSKWDNLRSGFYKNNDKIFYEDFAAVVLSTNPFLTTVTIELIDQNGFVFKENPITQVLEKDTTFQWIASEHFGNNEGLNFFSGLSVKISASAPVYVLPPTQFSAQGKADGIFEAMKNAWWSNFSMEVPYAVEWSQEGNRIIFPYSIHWHNFGDWPEGWDTVFTIFNKSQLDTEVKVRNRPLYNNIQDCSDSTGGKWENIAVGEKEKLFLVNPDKIEIFRLSEFLEISDDVSHNTEGAVIFLVPDTEVRIMAKVVPRPNGSRVCPKD